MSNPIGPFSVSTLPAILVDGVWRVLGLLPSKTEDLAKFPKFAQHFEAAAPLQEIDLQWYNNPILDQGQTSSCFPGGTPILMADGTEKSIENVQIGDTVITHRGRKKLVTQLFSRVYTGDVYCLKVKHAYERLFATEEHPIFTIKKNKLKCYPIKSIKEGDYVLGLKDKSRVVETDSFAVKELKVYNLEVADDNSYIVQGIAVHNCVGHAGAAGMDLAWAQSGRAKENFEPYFLYGMINGGRDAGASISDAMTALTNTGICERGVLPGGVMFKSQFPQEAFTNAGRFKILKAFHCQNYDEICQAVNLGFPTLVGLMVGNNFSMLDSEGVAPIYSRNGGGAHCVLAMGLKNSSKYGWCIKVQNSWGCYDKQTEVLTDIGWKLFKDLTGNEKIATLNTQTHNLEYQYATEYHEYDYCGNLRHYKARDIDLLVTSNHKMYVRRNHKKKAIESWELIASEDLKVKNLHFKKNAVWNGEEVKYYQVGDKKIDMDLWLEFLGYYISEGNTSYCEGFAKSCERIRTRWIKGKQIHDKKTGQYQYVDKDKDIAVVYKTIEKDRIVKNFTIYISQTKEIGVAIIAKCLQKMPHKFTRWGNGWTTNSQSLYKELKPFGYSYEKYIPEYVKDLSSRQQKIFFDALMVGDGSYSKCKNSEKVTYYTSSKRLADDVQELLLKIGFAGDIAFTDRIGRENKKGGVTRHIEYRIGIKRKEIEPRSKYVPSLVPYCDKVYCVTVPNHVIFVRRNGKAVWCGNSNFGLQGHCYLQREHFQFMNPDAFAIQALAEDPQDSQDVPVVQLAVQAKLEIDKISLVNFGFTKDQIAEFIGKYGKAVLQTIAEGLRLGLTKEFVLEILQKFGPAVLQLLASLFNRKLQDPSNGDILEVLKNSG